MIDELIKQYMSQYTHTIQQNDEFDNEVYRVVLDLGHQHFKLSAYCETEKQAQWYQRQLAIALIRFKEKARVGE